MEEDIARVRRDIGGPSLTGMSYDELTAKSEERRKAPVHLRQPGRSRGLVKKVLATAVVVGAIVAGSMYAGAKCEKQISAIENTVTNYVNSSADNQTYAAEAVNRE